MLETNTNRFPPLTPACPESKVFRFLAVKDVQALCHTHHQLLQKYAAGLWAQGEPRGEQIQRLVRIN